MATYNFEKFKNAKGEEILSVFSPGKMCKTTEETLNTPSHEKAKKLFSAYVDDISELSKEDFISDYITFEAGIKGLDAEDLYNQVLNFK